jgi:hypothetical protein
VAGIGVKYSKLQGSTLVETLVAFTVLLVCVSMAALIISRVIGTSGRFDYLEAWIALHNVEAETSRTRDYTETEISYNHFRVKRLLEPSPYTPSVFILELKVIDTGSKVRLIHRTLILPSDEHH